VRIDMGLRFRLLMRRMTHIICDVRLVICERKGAGLRLQVRAFPFSYFRLIQGDG
jgi:hypothetical protein